MPSTVGRSGAPAVRRQDGSTRSLRLRGLPEVMVGSGADHAYRLTGTTGECAGQSGTKSPPFIRPSCRSGRLAPGQACEREFLPQRHLGVVAVAVEVVEREGRKG